MNVQPSKHLILINGHTHQGSWFEGNSQMSFADPFTLAECWRNYFNNQIINIAQNLWKIIILWEAQIEFSSLIPDHIQMLLLNCGLLIIVILEGSSSQGKLQCLNQFNGTNLRALHTDYFCQKFGVATKNI